MIEIKQIHTKNDLKKFVKFPFTLYKDCKYWVPPIIKAELETLDATKNPVFENAEAQSINPLQLIKLVPKTHQ